MVGARRQPLLSSHCVFSKRTGPSFILHASYRIHIRKLHTSLWCCCFLEFATIITIVAVFWEELSRLQTEFVPSCDANSGSGTLIIIAPLMDEHEEYWRTVRSIVENIIPIQIDKQRVSLVNGHEILILYIRVDHPRRKIYYFRDPTAIESWTTFLPDAWRAPIERTGCVRRRRHVAARCGPRRVVFDDGREIPNRPPGPFGSGPPSRGALSLCIDGIGEVLYILIEQGAKSTLNSRHHVSRFCWFIIPTTVMNGR
jgi:hypothetical protein